MEPKISTSKKKKQSAAQNLQRCKKKKKKVNIRGKKREKINPSESVKFTWITPEGLHFCVMRVTLIGKSCCFSSLSVGLYNALGWHVRAGGAAGNRGVWDGWSCAGGPLSTFLLQGVIAVRHPHPCAEGLHWDGAAGGERLLGAAPGVLLPVVSGSWEQREPLFCLWPQCSGQ